MHGKDMCKAQFSLQTRKMCSLKHVEIPRYQLRSILGILKETHQNCLKAFCSSARISLSYLESMEFIN